MIIRNLSICALAAAAAFPQDTGSVMRVVQQNIGEVRGSIARNRTQLRQYAWTETIEISLKGEIRKREQTSCQYGRDGTLLKAPIGAPAPLPSGGPLKRRIVARKVDGIKDYMDRVSALVRRYIPPDPGSMQAAFQAGRVTIEPASGALVFNDYVKPGDKVTLTFDVLGKKLLEFAVATYLDEPKDAVTIESRFSNLPDGTNFMAQSVLTATAKQIQVTTTDFGYQKVK